MSYITVETDINLDDYLDEIIYMFKRNNRFRENLLQAMEDNNIGFVLNRCGDDKCDDRKTQLSKISENYWTLTGEDEELINKIADRF